MDVINTNCPGCGDTLEFPRDFGNVICGSCGATYLVREHKGALNLSPMESRAPRGVRSSEEEMSDLDERIAELGAEIEAIRSKEQGAPLQAGCALFGVFFLAILVITFFMTLGINYFAKWPFYLSLAVVVALGLMRMRRKLPTQDDVDDLRIKRARLEDDFGRLEIERKRLLDLDET